MSDVWMYTSKGYVNVEQDDIDPPPQYVCNDCGWMFNVDDGAPAVCPCDDCNSTDITNLYIEG